MEKLISLGMRGKVKYSHKGFGITRIAGKVV